MSVSDPEPAGLDLRHATERQPAQDSDHSTALWVRRGSSKELVQWRRPGLPSEACSHCDLLCMVPYQAQLLLQGPSHEADDAQRQSSECGPLSCWTRSSSFKKSQPTLPAPKSQFTTTTDALLPKQQQQQAKLKKDIETLIAATTLENAALEWEDPHRLHLKISECMTNSNLGLSIKQNKKLQKIYNDYTTVTTKINKTMEKITKIERANAKLAPKLEPAWDDELGPPPNSPPELIRQSACELVSECWGCETSQPNQMAHMGGCLPDELEAGEAEEEVPDSWEDL